MKYVRGFGFCLWALLACGVRADTIPTLTATSGAVNVFPFTQFGEVVGPDFDLFSPVSAITASYPCSVPFPPGGCFAPGPTIVLHQENTDAQYGNVTLGGTTYRVYFEGNAQIQYLTPVIPYPAPSSGFSSVTIPAILSGSERACLIPPDSSGGDPCSDALGAPGYPDYIANISINVPGTLTLLGNGGPLGNQLTGASFVSSPEPGSIMLACIGFLVLLTGYRVCRRRPLL